MRAFTISIASILLLVSTQMAQHADHQTPKTSPADKPIELVSTDAISHRRVSTSVDEAQKFFDQGLTFYYAFNDGDAIRSFRRAAELDPKLAIAHWGIALAEYPRSTGGGNPDDKERMKKARNAIKVAMSMQSPPSDRVYIEALSKLFSDDASITRKILEDAYRVSMKGIYDASPRDADAVALYALSIFYSAGYSNWTRDGEPVGRWPEMLAVLETGLKRHPKHVGLTHTYIHAVEESLMPERALAAADTLRGQKIFIPSFGHLVHMPAHIYVRTGNFQRSIESNEETAKMPTDTLSEEFKLWHYNHVLNFLLFSYAMQGNSAMVSNTLDRKFGYYTPRYSDQRPRYWVRFKRWRDILSAPAPPADSRPETKKAWTWARAMALAATGDVVKAEAERSSDKTDLHPLRRIDDARIDAAIARNKGEKTKEIDLFRDAVDAEDTLGYSEPPLSISPVRENLGGALLRNEQFVEAEKTFREDLRRNPGSGRSLFGLMTALDKQGKTDEAQLVRKLFVEAWKYADIKLSVEDL